MSRTVDSNISWLKRHGFEAYEQNRWRRVVGDRLELIVAHGAGLWYAMAHYRGGSTRVSDLYADAEDSVEEALAAVRKDLEAMLSRYDASVTLFRHGAPVEKEEQP